MVRSILTYRNLSTLTRQKFLGAVLLKAIIAIALSLYSLSHISAASAEPTPPQVLAKAELDFWQAASDARHTGLISAYLLHFTNGRFTTEATRLFQEKTGTTWTAQLAAETAWRNPFNDKTIRPNDTALAGQWMHTSICDVNFFVQDVEVESRQIFNIAQPGILNGTSTFRHGNRLEGRGEVLEVRRDKSLITYVMQAENNLTGSEVHIGILNLSQSNGQFQTRGWEMNTGGAYCDMSGQKVS